MRNFIPVASLIEVLDKWGAARPTYRNALEKAENMRCALDIVRLLSDAGVEISIEIPEETGEDHQDYISHDHGWAQPHPERTGTVEPDQFQTITGSGESHAA